MKNIRNFYQKSFIFLVVKFSIYLNRCVFVMQPVHPPSMAGVLVYLALGSLEAVELACDRRRL